MAYRERTDEEIRGPLVGYFRKLKDPNKRETFFGRRSFSPNEIADAIEKNKLVGQKLIELFRMLGKKRDEDPLTILQETE